MTGAAVEIDSVRSVVAGEQGGVIVMVAIALPLLILLVGFVIDIGNWFVHQRHLQTQADAAALAGAGEFGTAFDASCDDAKNVAIESAARAYSGEQGGGYNHQIGRTSTDEVHFALNSANFYENSGPVDETVVEGPPCEAGMVDVKMTETDLPLFLKVAGLFSNVDYINTHARVEIFQRDRLTNGLPLGVPDPNPKVGRVIFVDETTGEELGSRPLTRSPDTSGGLAIWSNDAAPFPLDINSTKVGVRVAFGGASSTSCTDPLVECYDAEDDGLGLLHVQGYSMADSGSQPNAPLARSVSLQPGSCADPYFVATEIQCTIGVRAEIDFGSCDQLSGIGPKLVARRQGSNTAYPLALSSCPSGSSASVWETTGAPIPINPGEGPVEITLDWEETGGTQGGETCNDTGGNKCKGSFGTVQRAFSATESRSGPIRLAQLWEDGNSWANSLERCSGIQSDCTYDVVAKIGIDLNLSENADSVDDEPVSLQFASDSGSRTQALNCDPDGTDPNDPDRDTLRYEIANGCASAYTRNSGTACPATKEILWALPAPWDCVALKTGDSVGQIWQGMNQRVHGAQSPSECVSPNNWADFPNLDPGDPRIVSVFITPFGAFQGQGGGTVPVSDFGTFYVTGWHGSQSTCPGGADYDPDDPAPDRSIVGHFIKYVQAFNDGSSGGEPCNFSELGSCVAVLTH